MNEGGSVATATASGPEAAGEVPDAAMPVTRYPSDVLRVVVGAVVLGLAVLVSYEVAGTAMQRNVSRLVNGLPGFLTPPARVLSGAAVGMVAVGVAAMGLKRRWHALASLAVTLVLAAVLAALAWKVGAHGHPFPRLFEPESAAGVIPTEGYPSLLLTLAAAAAGGLAPYVDRSLQRMAWTVVLAAAVSEIVLGRALPVDVVTGFAAGWLAASGAHLLLGVPARRADLRAVAERLGELGLPVRAIRPATADARASVPYRVTPESGGELFMKQVTSENRDATLLFEAYRAVAYRGLEDEDPFLRPKQAVEHEAFVALLALQAGVRTPRPRLAAAVSSREAVLVQDMVPARGLDGLGAGEISDATIADLWDQVARLRAANIAHRDLRLGNMMVDADGRAWIIDFGFAENAASPRRLAQDVAELLASLATVVGVERALVPAVDRLGAGAVGGAVPLLQPPALSGATRSALKGQKGLLDSLRAATADAAGLGEPELERIQRVHLGVVLQMVVLAGSLYLLLPEVADLWDRRHILADADWNLVGLGLLASAGTYVFDALELQAASVAPLPLWRTVQARLASSFANRFAPAGLGGATVTIRYLQRSGADLPTATGTYGLAGLAGCVVPVLGTAVSAVAAGRSAPIDLSVTRLPVVLLVTGAVLALGGVVWFVRPVHSRVVPAVVQAARNLSRVFREPSRAVQLFGSQAAVTFLYLTAFVLSCRAFGLTEPAALLALLYLTAATVGSAAPTPGGLGAVEALLAGALISVGADSGAAVAAVLTFRLLTYWMPIPFGAWSLAHLRKEHYL